jgi:two-component system, cell cycle response regulator
MVGPDIGKVFQLPDKALTIIGREETADIRLSDPEISREHAAVASGLSRGGLVLRDLESRNGTLINGEPCAPERPLKVGDIIRLGGFTTLRVCGRDEMHGQFATSMYEAVLRDFLTGAFNRRYLDERLAGEMAFAKRHKRPLSLVMLDLDHFKAINDTHGHSIGDAVLQRVAQLLQTRVRTEDVVVRFGGEEFVILCRDTEPTSAVTMAERLRRLIAERPVCIGVLELPVTVSLGIAGMGEDCQSPASLIEAADRQLYRAKGEGRNRCCGPDASGP